MTNPNISEVPVRETVGRDTIARFNAQFRGAALKSLEILDGGPIDRVYCDFQDDYVAREMVSGEKRYHFYQVKTKSKKNHLYSVRELFGLYKNRGVDKQKSIDIAKSYIGLLILHTINFDVSCSSVNFQTNINFDDTVEALAKAIETLDFANKHLSILIEKFVECFPCSDDIQPDEIYACLQKLSFQSGLVYLHPDDDSFSVMAREAIYKYSEVDLKNSESKQIVANLIALIEKKSLNQVLENTSEDELDEIAGVGISDLLSILSISKGAYDLLIANGDEHAIRNVSIIQRKLDNAGATNEMIEYASKCKAQWDTWVRQRRHYISELEFNLFLQELDNVVRSWVGGSIPMLQIKTFIDQILANHAQSTFFGEIDHDLVFGGLLARVVRSELQ